MPITTILSVVNIVLASFTLYLMIAVVFGPLKRERTKAILSRRQAIIMAAIMAAVGLWNLIFPQNWSTYISVVIYLVMTVTYLQLPFFFIGKYWPNPEEFAALKGYVRGPYRRVYMARQIELMEDGFQDPIWQDMYATVGSSLTSLSKEEIIQRTTALTRKLTHSPLRDYDEFVRDCYAAFYTPLIGLGTRLKILDIIRASDDEVRLQRIWDEDRKSVPIDETLLGLTPKQMDEMEQMMQSGVPYVVARAAV